MTVLVLIFVVSTLGTARAQNEDYGCVPYNYCKEDNERQESSGVDPRIAFGNESCPSGQVPCYTQGTNSQCGYRYVTQTRTSDGPADNGAYPWQAYLRNSTHSFAGSGVLLNNYHVLTAAHKVAGSVSSPSNIQVFLGVYSPDDLRTNVQSRAVSRIIVHRDYVAATLRNDIAILRLSTPVSLSSDNINTACLPPGGTSFVGQRCVVSGWGQSTFEIRDAPTRPMKQVYLNVVSTNTCRASYSDTALLGSRVDTYLDPAGEICAGGQALKDACSQDGGSPLVCPSTSGRHYVAGLVIWGKKCGRPGVYGVYVNVPYYRRWIDDNTRL